MSRPIPTRTTSFTLLAAIVYATALTGMSTLSAQSLPAPSRTMYKCKVGGTTSYSDKPCLGATKLEVEPTRGVSKLSGHARTGNDVANERYNEVFAEALRPISGMDAKQLTTFGRRNQLSPLAQQACRRLDHELPLAEDEEKHAAQANLREVQERLFFLRKKFQELRC